MTLYIKTDSVPEGCDYITAGKVYRAEHTIRNHIYRIGADNGGIQNISMKKECSCVICRLNWHFCNQHGTPVPAPWDQKCNCSLRTSVLGDGCSVCNPELARDIEMDNARDDADMWQAHAEALAEAGRAWVKYDKCDQSDFTGLMMDYALALSLTVQALAAFNQAKGE